MNNRAENEMTMTLRRLAGSILAAIAPVVALVTYLAVRGSVPDPLPVHFNAQGEVDNTQSVQSFFLITLLIAIGCAAVAILVTWLAHTPIVGRLWASIFTFTAWVFGGMFVSIMLRARGHTTASDVTMPWYTVAAVIVVPALLGLAAWALLPGHWQHALTPTRPVDTPLTFAPHEQVVWVGHAHSVPLRILAPVAAIVGAVFLFIEVSVAIPVLIGAVVLGFVCELAVRIDARGVHTLWGPFGWPRQRIKLADITAAGAQDIKPMEWGGWGYRVSSRGVAAVVRSGPGLVIDREGKSTYIVTVDDAEHGANVLNGLLQREHEQRA